MKIIGLMSGTSMDGIDAALVSYDASGRYKLIAEDRATYPKPVARYLKKLVSDPVDVNLRRFGDLHHELGQIFGESANRLADKAAGGKVDLIASHGQTVAHFPADGKSKFNSTFQLGDPDIIADRTGTTTVADFRWGHIAAGGEGAPVSPYFLSLLAADSKRDRLLLNLGGIANLSIVPTGGGADDTWGFDSGPANTLLDAFAGAGGMGPYDKNGRLAKMGKVSAKWLEAMKEDKYFKLPPPKSTGREYFNTEWALEKYPPAKRYTVSDRLATQTELTAWSVADAIERHVPDPPDTVYVYGGGAQNRFLMSRLEESLAPLKLKKVTEIGLSVDMLEAMGIAVLGLESLRGTDWPLGDTQLRMGRIVPGTNWEKLMRRVLSFR